MAAPNGWNEEVKMYKCVWTVCLMCVNMNEYMNEAEEPRPRRGRGRGGTASCSISSNVSN